MNIKPSTMAWILKLISPYKNYYIVSVTMAFVSVLCSFMPYFYVANIVRDLLAGLREWEPYLQNSAWIAIFWLVSILARYLSTTASHKAAFHLLADLRLRLTSKLAKLSLGSIMNQPSGSYKNIICERVESMETTLAHLIPEFTSYILSPLVVFVYMLFLDWRVTLASLLVIPIGLFFYANMMRKSTGEFENTIAKTKALNDTAVEYINGIEVIKVFGQEQFSYEKFVTAVQEGASCFIKWMQKCNLDMAGLTTITPTLMLFLLPFGAYFRLNGSLSSENLILLIILSMGLIQPILAAAAYLDDIYKVSAIFEEAIEIFERPDLKRPKQLENIPQGTKLELDHVRFSYTDGEEILHDISLTIQPQTVTALVGPSGSGKSTIAKLITSFWDVNEGEIRFGGVPINELPLDYYMQQIAYVSQDNYLFNDSILENIRMGNLEATDEEVISIAKQSGCYDFIMQLDKGFDTLVGSSGGASLSGGERQRIAIARAMLKNAPIIILDEATAYTDPENESLIQSSIAQLVAGKTLIVIAHRLSTIADSDQIIVVNKGRIEAVGKHPDLLAQCPLYKGMWESHIAARDDAHYPVKGETIHA